MWDSINCPVFTWVWLPWLPIIKLPSEKSSALIYINFPLKPLRNITKHFAVFGLWTSKRWGFNPASYFPLYLNTHCSSLNHVWGAVVQLTLTSCKNWKNTLGWKTIDDLRSSPMLWSSNLLKIWLHHKCEIFSQECLNWLPFDCEDFKVVGTFIVNR